MTRFIKGHKLKRNKKATLPTRMLFYDSETKYVRVGLEQHHTLDFGWLNFTERTYPNKVKSSKHHFIDSTDRFNSTVERYAYKDSKLYLFAHNVFFDIQVSGFFPYFTKAGWTLDFYYDKGLVYILSIRKGTRKIVCLSTTNYFSEKLAVVGKMIGLEKTEIDFEKSSHDEKVDYCFNDMMIIKKGMEYYFTFLIENDMGRFGLTKSAQALSVYRHRFMSANIFIHEEEQALALERETYHGGRTECFKLGEIKGGPFVCVDVNSMYPFIMKTQNMPSRLIDFGGAFSTSHLESLLKTNAVIAKVKVNTDSPMYAIKRNQKLIYPVGTFDCFLCTEGLTRALQAGHIVKVYETAVYETQNLFESYVNHFYKLRQQYKKEGNDIYQTLCKYFMNTLYGKFGQKRTLTEMNINYSEPEYIRHESFDMETFELRTYTKIFNTWLSDTDEVNGKNSFVAIPAHITEYGRLMLWDFINAVGYENALYCDTDSLFLPEKFIDKLAAYLDDKKLGALKLEYQTAKLTIHGCKDYQTDYATKIKGVPRNAEQLSENTFKYNQFLGQSSHLRRSLSDIFVIKEIVKTNKRIYDKGVVDAEGNVKPFSLGET